MENKTFTSIVTLVVLVILAVGGLYLFVPKTAPTPENPEPIACTLDARICPDGSAVGRIPPNCDFALCPVPQGTSTPTVGTTSLGIKLGQTLSTQSISLTPLDLLEDSRCPQNVQCIQAGTVRVKTRVTMSPTNTSEIDMTLGQSNVFGAYTVTLVSVDPVPVAGTPMSDSLYVFNFQVVVK